MKENESKEGDVEEEWMVEVVQDIKKIGEGE